MIDTHAIHPSPYQPRHNFDDSSLAALADNIQDHGLIHPILVRSLGDGYELVSGERRLRAVRDRLDWQTIPAVIRPLTDLQAQIVCLSENLQRDDLTKVEEIESIARWVDARMRQDDSYLLWLGAMFAERKGGPKLKLNLDDEIDRAVFFLALADSDYKNGTDRVRHKFMSNLEAAFQDVNKPIDWRSFTTNDLPLIRDLPTIVREAAISNRLNEAHAQHVWSANAERRHLFKLSEVEGWMKNRKRGTCSHASAMREASFLLFVLGLVRQQSVDRLASDNSRFNR